MRSPALLTAFLKARQERKADPDLDPAYIAELKAAFKAASGARTLNAARTDSPFLERLAQFWSNHFTVSIQRPVVLPVAAAYEDEAIRPHVLGRFRDMLQAVVRHPAMLLYLDNAQSEGPASPAGRLKARGLNENLARELLELHTIGVDGGYTQSDVTEFARILTGWSIARPVDPDPGTFRYRPAFHQPGSKTLLGETYEDAQMEEGEKALDRLAALPATARHIASKLARHFIADEPPPEAVDRLAHAFRDSEGDLPTVYRTLIDLPAVWSSPLAKIKSPNDLVVSAHRAFGVTDDTHAETALGALHLMGQVPFNAASPAGWPDTASAWVAPEAVMTRIDWALAAGQKLSGHADAHEVARNSLGPLASERTLAQLDNAPSAAEAIALLIASPEFQRR